MQRAICRINKLKASQLGKANGHNRRERDVPNADPDGEAITLKGEGQSIPDLVASRIAEAGITKTRKDAVHAVEVVLSASPEFFRPDNPGAWGEYDPTRLDAWLSRTTQFLEAKWGDRVVSVDLHLDEATPHVHAVVVPVVEKQRKLRGKDEYRTVNSLCAKDEFNRQSLRDLQTEYAAAHKDIGLLRGVEGSKGNHTSIKQFYSLMKSTPVTAPDPVKIRFTELPDKRTALNRERMQAWLNDQAEKAQRAIAVGLKAWAESATDWKDQAKHYHREWMKTQRELLAFCREFGSPEGVRAALDAKDAQIASQEATEASLTRELTDTRESLENAQEAIQGLESELAFKAQELEFSRHQAELKNRDIGPSL